MKTVMEFFLVCILRTALWFRYRIKVNGYDKLNKEHLKKSGGVLFLPNHPTVFIDATSVVLSLWPKYPVRPLIIEYMFQLPVVNQVMRMLNAIPVPNFSTSSNSLKKKKTEKLLQTVIADLDKGENFLLFPSGRVKHTAYEAIDGASAVHRILQEAPNANIVLVRIKGLYGSSFSRALTGKNPAMMDTVLNGIKHVFKNLIFFTPRRDIIIDFVPAPADFPYNANRIELNRYLERFYNQPDGIRPPTSNAQYPGDSLALVSYSMWKEELPTVWEKPQNTEENISLESVSPDVRNKVLGKLAELTSRDPSTFKSDMNLSTDLGLDSLDVADLAAFLDDQFDVAGLTVEDLTSVGKVLGLASKKLTSTTVDEDEDTDTKSWNVKLPHKRIYLADGDTMPEVFLNICDKMGKSPACVDARAGVVTFAQLKLRALVLAEYIRRLPGDYIGIMLPASVAATVTIFACQLAGKVPLMVNWTVGPRHLQSVKELSKVQVVLSGWGFIEKLQNVDLGEMDDLLVMLEDVRRELTLKDKLKALFLSKCSTKTILRTLGLNKLKPEDKAVLLFTSGTESMPKGVPLSHRNIISNQRVGLETIEIFEDDIIFNILPPFHSFGFTVSSSMVLLGGARVAFSPDPTNGKQLAKGFARWGVTIMCGAPTFIKNLLKAATPEQLKTMRLCVTGAEKAPADLYLALKHVGKDSHLIEGYGITECAPMLTVNPEGDTLKGVGKALPNVDVLIVNIDTHKPTGAGEQGLIVVRGPNIFSGYVNPGIASPFITVDGKEWYVTGDLGYLDVERNLIITGRLKRFIKIGGEMISLASIEDALSKAALSKGVKPVEEGPLLAVCAKETAGEKPKISLFCCFPENVDDANKSLKDAGFSNLVKISTVTQVHTIPIMGTGKTNYRALESV